MAKLEKKVKVEDLEMKPTSFIKEWWSVPIAVALLLAGSIGTVVLNSETEVITSDGISYISKNDTLKDEIKALKKENKVKSYVTDASVETKTMTGVADEIIAAQTVIAKTDGDNLGSEYNKAFDVMVKYFGSENRSDFNWLTDPSWTLELGSKAPFAVDNADVIFYIKDKDSNIVGIVTGDYNFYSQRFNGFDVEYVGGQSNV